jgi:HPt (histidine-containing phosphotransfer) domain-containing protein
MLKALASLQALDTDGRLLARLAAAFAQTVQAQRPQLTADGGPAHARAAHTLRAAALQLGAEELEQLCAQLEAAPDGALLPRLDVLLADAQQALEAA